MFDLRDPAYRPGTAYDPTRPRRDYGMSDVDSKDTGASAIVRLLVDLAPDAVRLGYPGVPRAWVSDKAQNRAPFSKRELGGSISMTMNAMVANGFLTEHPVRNPMGRPTRHLALPDGTITTPVDGDGSPYPFLGTELYGTFVVPVVGDLPLRLHQVKVLCIARGRQLDRSYLCHQYPMNGTIEVWRER